MKEEAIAAIAWERLRAADKSGSVDLGIPSLELDTSSGAGRVRLALGGDGDPRLLLPLGPGDAFPQTSDTPALELKDSVLQLRGRPTRFLEIVSRDPNLENVFQKLAADIVRRLGEGASGATAVEDAMADFRALLLAARRLPTTERAAGLIGELIILNRLLTISPSAWRTWTGPLAGRHDFRNGDIAIEVKTSLRAQRKVLEISAIDQLLAPDGGELVLAHHIIEHDAGGALNAAEEAEKAMTSSDDPAALADRLAEVGFATELRDQWAAFRFSLLATDFYSVSGEFPRLSPTSFIEGELPLGVSHFRYRVDLSFAAGQRIITSRVDDLLGRFAS